MSKKNFEDNRIKETVAFGRDNKKLIPKLQNWCAYLKIEDISGGMIHQIYKVPIRLRLSCKHANLRLEGSFLEVEARDFILKSCINCSFRKELSPFNLGQRIIREHKEWEIASEIERKELEQSKKQFKGYVNQLIKKEKGSLSTPKLSILKLIGQLEIEDKKEEISKKILEASLLEPTFFNELTLNVLSAYFDDEIIGETCLEIVGNISSTYIDAIYFQRTLKSIVGEHFSDFMVKIILPYIKEDNWQDYEDLINVIVQRLRYKRFFGEPGDFRRSYPNTISLFQKLLQFDFSFVIDLLRKRLKINDKDIRINTCFFIQELLPVQNKIGYELINELILSLELADTSYEQSADGIACETIFKILKIYPQYAVERLFELFPKLSNDAKEEFLQIFSFLKYRSRKDTTIKDSIKEQIVNKLTKAILFNKEKELEAKLLYILKSVSENYPKLFISHFSTFLNHLKNLFDEKKRFEFYKNDLNNGHAPLTFNPLINLNHLDIILKEQTYNKRTSDTIQIIANIFEVNQSKYIDEFINNIDNRTNTDDYKLHLIDIIKKGCSDNLILRKFIPVLYNFLLNENDQDIRRAGFQFLNHIIKNHHQLVTDNLIELILIFLEDERPLVKGYALENYKQIIKTYPNQISKAQIEIIIKSFESSYLFILSKSSELLYDVFKYFTPEQELLVLQRLTGIENYHFKKKEYEKSKKYRQKIFFFYGKDEKSTTYLIEKFLLKYCHSQRFNSNTEYYDARDAIKQLFKLQENRPQLGYFWVKESLSFLKKTFDKNMGSDNPRTDIFINFYNLNWLTIEKTKTLIISYIKEEYNNHKWDIIRLLEILAYYEFHEEIVEICELILPKIPKNKQNEYIIERLNIIQKISQITLKSLIIN